MAMAVVPAFDVAGAAKAAVAHANLVDVGSQSSLDVFAEPVSAEWTWIIMQRVKMRNYFMRLAFYLVFVALFTVIFEMLRPVASAFAVQDAILEQTSREGLPQAGWTRTFHDISSDEDWWQWVEEALLPTILNERYFNGDLRSESWGQRFTRTVAMYNTQTAPIRFRQARVRDNTCDTPKGDSSLVEPCWGHFTKKRQFKEALGESYGGRYLIDLNRIGIYGDEAHIVDVPLSLPVALDRASQMRLGGWLNEQTRMVAVETSWYNANLDLSTYCRWQMEVTPGGLVIPSVEIHSCRLHPYTTTRDMIRVAFELVFIVSSIYYWAEALHDIKQARFAWFRHFWNLMEFLNLCLYFVLIFWWLRYVLMKKDEFEEVSTGTYNQRPDISELAAHFDYIANFAAFTVAFSYVKIFKYLQMYPPTGIIWRILSLSMTDMWPFLFVFVLFTCGFSFAGHWMFGCLMTEFHSWGQSFVTLLLTIVGGFPYDAMKQTSPVSAVMFTIAWVFMMVMVAANMFVAILAEWYRRVVEEKDVEDAKLARVVGEHAHIGIIRPCLRWFAGLVRGEVRDKASLELDAMLREAAWMLRWANLQNVEHVRAMLHSGEELHPADLVRHFGHDRKKTEGFVRKVQDIASHVAACGNGDENSAMVEDSANFNEQERLEQLQRTVTRMEDHMKQLRQALHKSRVATLQAGQSIDGYSVVEEEKSEAAASSVAPAGPAPQAHASQAAGALPGAVAEE